MVYIRVEAEVRPTEDEDKVVRAIRNIIDFDNLKVVDAGRGYRIVIAESNSIKSLQKLHDLLRRQRILDTARNLLLRKAKGGSITLNLNKQAAYQGVVSFAEGDLESPLGTITITIVSENPEDVVDWLAPRTSRGRPLWERAPPED